MAVKLPIKQPPITSYQQIALPLTVAMQSPKAENWFYSNYILAACVRRKHYLSKGNRDNALHYGFYNPRIDPIQPLKHITIEGNEQLFMFGKSSFIKDALDDGWYIYTDADMFYIDGSNTYEKYHYTHDLMIYGYDNYGKVYIYMYDESKLSTHVVSFENFINGYYSEFCNETFYRDRAILFKPSAEEQKVNIAQVRWHMHDYLDGIESFPREYPNKFYPDALSAIGIQTYDEFADFFDFLIEHPYKYMRRVDLYCFYEHKKVMFDRVKYFREHGVLKADDDLIASFDDICKKANRVMLLGLKCNAVSSEEQKNRILCSLKKHVGEIRELEVKTWNRYIDLNKELLG